MHLGSSLGVQMSTLLCDASVCSGSAGGMQPWAHNGVWKLQKSSLLLPVVQLSSRFVPGSGTVVLQLLPCACLVLHDSLQNVNFADRAESSLILAGAIRALGWRGFGVSYLNFSVVKK